MSEYHEPYECTLRAVAIDRDRLVHLSLQLLKAVGDAPELANLPPLEALIVLEHALGIYYQSCGAVLSTQKTMGQMLPIMAMAYEEAEQMRLDVKCRLIENARMEHQRIMREAKAKAN